MKLNRIVVSAALIAVASTAYAAVNFDGSTGTGFVGKGDVQLAFGWNNAALQKNAGGVTFTYDVKDTYDVECYWETETGNGKIIVHDVTIPKQVKINSTVAFDARVKNQITGFNLTGFGAITTTGTVPAVGDACPGNNPGLVTGATLTGSTGGLYVNYGGIAVAMPNTPLVTTTITTQ